MLILEISRLLSYINRLGQWREHQSKHTSSEEEKRNPDRFQLNIISSIKRSGVAVPAAAVLDDTIPLSQRLARAPEPSPELMEEDLRILATEKLLDHVLSLACATLRVNCPEDGEDVFDQEVCFDTSRSVGMVGIAVVRRAQVIVVLLNKFEDE